MTGLSDRIRIATTALFFLWSFIALEGQTILRISKSSWGSVHVTDVHTHTVVKYKTNRAPYRKGELVAMRDSFLFFKSGDTVLLNEIRGIKIPNYRYSFKPLQNKLIYAGLLLIPLSLTNQLITGREPNVAQSILIVSGSLIAAGAIFGILRMKRIRVNSNTSLQVLDYDYEHLGPGGTEVKK